MAARHASALMCAGLLSLGCVEQGFAPPYGIPPYSGAPGYGPPSYPAPGYGAPFPYGAYPGAPAGQAPGTSSMWSPAAASAAVAFARSRLGTPYCWGGNGPRCFDCSGLTRAAWRAGGRSIPRTSEEQMASLTPVSPAALAPGDILWRPGHVGLYVGQGWAIAATHTGDFVRYQRADHFQRAVRPN